MDREGRGGKGDAEPGECADEANGNEAAESHGSGGAGIGTRHFSAADGGTGSDM